MLNRDEEVFATTLFFVAIYFFVKKRKFKEKIKTIFTGKGKNLGGEKQNA